MASGNVTGYQHQLIKEEELTKERFAELCDQWFYHLPQYDMKSVDELEAYRLKEIQNYQEKIQEYTSRLTVLETGTTKEIEEQYEDYVTTAHAANSNYREIHQHEVARLAQAREYAAAFSPHLDHVWEALQDPELFQVDIFGFDEWLASQKRTTEHGIRFYSDLKAKAGMRDDMNTEAGRRVDDYERRKMRFLSNQ